MNFFELINEYNSINELEKRSIAVILERNNRDDEQIKKIKEQCASKKYQLLKNINLKNKIRLTKAILSND